MLARIVWGTYKENNCPSSNGHFLLFETQKCLLLRHGGGQGGQHGSVKKGILRSG